MKRPWPSETGHRFTCEICHRTYMDAFGVKAHCDNCREALLFKAAPDLLEICLELANWESDPDRYAGDLAELAAKARTAIAKATRTPDQS